MKGQNELIIAVAIVFLAIALGITVQLWNPGNQPTGFAGAQAPEELTPIQDGHASLLFQTCVEDDASNFISTASDSHYGATMNAFLKFDLTGKTAIKQAYLVLSTSDSDDSPSGCAELFKIDDYVFSCENWNPPKQLISSLACNCNSGCVDDEYINVTSFIQENAINAFMLKHIQSGYGAEYRRFSSSESINPPRLELVYFVAPETPAYFTAVPGSNPGEIRLQWNSTAETDYYEIDWKVGDVANPSYFGTETVQAPATSKIHLTPQNAQEQALIHSYTIKACNPGGCSAPSSLVTAFPKIGAEANGPYNITAGQNSILNGIANYAAGSKTFLWEELLDNAACNLTNVNQPNPTINCQWTGQAQIKLTVTSSLNGTATDTAIINVTENPPSNPPESLTVVSGNNPGEINLSWSQVSQATFYEVDWWTNSGKTTISNISSTSFVFSSQQNPLDNALMHNFSVKACNTGDCSSDSVTRSAYPKIGVSNSGGPYNKTLSGASIDLQLNASVQYAAGPVFNWNITNNNANCSPANPTGKNPIITCYTVGTANINVLVTGTDGQTSQSSNSTITITKAAPGIPQNLNVITGNNEGEINILWDAVTGAGSYVLRWNSGEGSTIVSATSFVHLTTETNNQGKEFVYEVKACDNSSPPLCSNYSVSDSAYPKIGARANGPYQTVKEIQLQLNGSAVFEVGTVSYSWSITNSSGTPNCSPASSTAQNPTITCANNGTASVSLTASTALNGTSNPKTTTIEVTNEPDNTSPTINLIQPEPNTTLTGTKTLSANARDNVAVRNVRFYLVNESSLNAIIEQAPYDYSWDTTTTPNGDYQLIAEATDTSGNTTETIPINVTLFNEVLECTGEQTQSCTTTEGCEGTQTCSNNSWGFCVDNSGDNCPAECTSGDTQECITSENCAGTRTCSAAGWSACQDNSGDNCPAQTQCTTASDCYSSYPKEKCDSTARKHYSRTVNCVSETCTAGNWTDSGEYCTKCSHCGDGELNCNESCDSCPTETGCQDTEAPEKPNGLTVYDTTENSVTIRWNPNTENDLKRYIIYFGTSSANYSSQKIALADEVELTITELQKATTYFIAIKALDLSENSSPYSNEVTALTKGTTEPDCTENGTCNELCDTDPDCTTKDCPKEKDGNCNKECDSDPDCEIPPKDNTIFWGIGTAIIAVSAALAYVFFTVEG